MLSTHIEILLNVLLGGDLQGAITSFLEAGIINGADQIASYYRFEDVIKQYLDNQREQEIKNQLEVIIGEIKPVISETINDRELELFSTIEEQLETKFQIFEIPIESRTNLKKLFQCYILDYIRNIDQNYYNDLLLQFQNEQQNALIREIYNILLQLQQAEKSPIIVPYRLPQIDDALKMVSRKKEIEQIDRNFCQGSHVAFLYGRPGIGKTTLAKMYAWDRHPSNVYFVKYERNLEYTIGKLSQKQSADSGRKILDYWKASEETQSVLLIIDNCNGYMLHGGQNHDFKEEIKGDFYKQLINTGIHIIFTTRINMGANTIEVQPVEEPFELFKMYYTKTIVNEAIINDIISALYENTLFIILAAHILSRCSSEEEQKQILDKIKNCNIKTDEKRLPVFADTDNAEVRTIYQQAEALLDMSGILGEEATKVVFANTVMLPMDGIQKREFLELTGSDENILMELIDGSWVLSDLDRIYLHPLVREVAFSKQFISYLLCEEYCKSIKGKIAIEEKFESRLSYKSCAQEIFNVFSMRASMNMTLLRLFYDLSDIYDELGERAMSREIVEIVEANIEAFAEYPFEKAKILSGIAYSLNNYYENMETLTRAEGLLHKALNAVKEQKQSSQWDYARTKGKILSNFGSNCLAKSKCDPTNKMKYLNDALKWHKQALEFRKEQCDYFMEEPHKIQILRKDIATSYTTVATDYFYLEEYKKSIDTHLRALEVRVELEDEKGKSINQQRIAGCVIEWYRQQLGIDNIYISQVLDYYPQLLETNYRHQNMNSLQKNMDYWTQLMRIVINDRRLNESTEVARKKCKHIIEWISSDIKLSEMFKNEVEELGRYL